MFRRKNDQSRSNGEEENPFLLSFSDLMASLLAIFILALVVMMIQLHLQKRKLDVQENSVVTLEKYNKLLKEKEDLEKECERMRLILKKLRKNLEEIKVAQNELSKTLEGVGVREKNLELMLKGIQRDLEEQGIQVIVADNGTVLRIPENALSFRLSEFAIQDHYQASADAIGAALLKALQNDQNRMMLDTVFIEGHTDSVPNRREMGNWGLSTYRAISLWLHWTEFPGKYASLKNLETLSGDVGARERPLISTSGYADTRPTNLSKSKPQESVEIGNSADRRIDIRFTLASSEKKNLLELKGLLDSIQRNRVEAVNLLDETK